MTGTGRRRNTNRHWLTLILAIGHPKWWLMVRTPWRGGVGLQGLMKMISCLLVSVLISED